ncbi:hypothetical protein LOK49_LG13G01602 [Camellia lanceoleosa]|uniref:Uncharacterized protein n=1 Tax=Camellia lanceoleosa TaxID=1840588 RepID=A0ACC0FGD5_9ERIC|nr:hypothetical protein LOK49_LG13G01602 [Camellia lanceoleosa]
MNERVMKIKEDLDMKRLYESRFGKMNNSNSFAFSSSSFPSTSNSEGNQNTISRLLSRGTRVQPCHVVSPQRSHDISWVAAPPRLWHQVSTLHDNTYVAHFVLCLST